MEEDELIQKIERVVSKTNLKPKRNKKKGKKMNQNQLWAQLNEKQLRKLGYIK